MTTSLSTEIRLLIVTACMVVVAASCHAYSLPDWNVYRMCADADAIVVANQEEGDRASVVQWIRGSVDGSPANIDIAGLGKHMKTPHVFWATGSTRNTTPLTTLHFVAFLTRKGELWQSMGTIEESGLTGSCGMIWIQNGHCYRYIQGKNPGPYVLYEARELKLESDLFKGIEAGLADGRAWAAALKIKDEGARAEALAAYTLPSTSPESPRTVYRSRVRKPLGALGGIAVSSLRRQIAAWKPGDNLDEVLLTLDDIGRDAKESVPDLLPLLNQPERVHPYYVLCALHKTADAAVVSAIKPFLKHPSWQAREEAEASIQSFTESH